MTAATKTLHDAGWSVTIHNPLIEKTRPGSMYYEYEYGKPLGWHDPPCDKWYSRPAHSVVMEHDRNPWLIRCTCGALCLADVWMYLQHCKVQAEARNGKA